MKINVELTSDEREALMDGVRELVRFEMDSTIANDRRERITRTLRVLDKLFASGGTS